MSRPRELPRTTIAVNGLSMALVDAGQGPPVVLLHGFPDSADLWRHQVPALAGAGFRVIAPDLRGMGETDAPPDTASYTNQHFFADFVALIDQLGLSHVDLVGHDIGAAAA
ncbi:MAG TPA: alpha/beta fold hydrolase [Actinomycetota bacterium]|nr:alpha/beta fold hydrolase [Actinomycetota bacterium]